MTIITDKDFTTGVYLTGSVEARDAVFVTESGFLVKYGYRVRASHEIYSKSASRYPRPRSLQPLDRVKWPGIHYYDSLTGEITPY